MSSGGGGGGETTTTSNEPPAYLLPFLERAMNKGEGLYNNNTLYRPDFNAQQLQGRAGAEGLANSSQLPQTAADYAQGYLGADPGARMQMIQDAADPYIEQLIPGLNSDAAMAGRSGSGLAANLMGEGIGREVSKSAADLRGHEALLAGLSPTLEQGRYSPYQELYGLGQQQQDRTRGQVEEPLDRFERYVSAAFGNAPGMQPGMGTSTQTTSGGGNSALQTMISLGTMIGGLPWSAEDLKDVHGTVDTASILEEFKKFVIHKWNYKWDRGYTHLGPMAHEWQRIGASNGRMVSVIDALGALAAAVGELARRQDESEKGHGFQSA